MTENRHRARSSPCIWLAIAGSVFAAASPLGALAEAAASSAPPGTEPIAAIRGAAVAFVRTQLPAAEIAAISAGALDDRLTLPRCGAPLAVEPLAGTQSMSSSTISVSCAKPEHWKVFVPVTVVRRVPVLILRHAVARGSHLAPSDVIVQVREITGIAAPFLGSEAQLAGRSTDRTLPAGTPLTADMFTIDPVISRGQDVTLVVQAAGFEVRAAGRALDDARLGDRLRVENLSSQRIVQGIAESSAIVEVED